jgi:hypothetical protein
MVRIGVPALRVYEDELQTLNRSRGTKNYHRLPEDTGGGYLAMLEVFHLLHCLVSNLQGVPSTASPRFLFCFCRRACLIKYRAAQDSLRKFTYKEHYLEIYRSENSTNRRIHTGV